MAGGEAAGNVQDRLAAPPVPAADAAEVVLAFSKYGREVPTFVAVKPVTALGSKKLSCAEDLIPLFLPIAIYLAPIHDFFIMLLDLQPIAKCLLQPW